VDINDVIANGRGCAELPTAVRTQIGFLLFETGLRKET
jgi:hypothetical protein